MEMMIHLMINYLPVKSLTCIGLVHHSGHSEERIDI